MRRRGVFLGFGHFGKTHVEVVGDLVRIVGVYSRTREKAERVLAYKAHADCKVFWGETIDPCLEWAQENGVDFVLVLLPIPLLHMAVTACLKRGLNVLSEKPCAKDLPSALTVVSLYRQSDLGLVWSVAENYRVETAFAQVRDMLVAPSQIGAVRTFGLTVHQSISTAGPPFQTDWRLKPEFEHGYLFDVGVHHVAALREMFRSRSLVCFSSRLSKQWENMPGEHDTLCALLGLDGGAVGTLVLSVGQFARREWEFFAAGEKGCVRISREGAGYRVKVEDGEKAISSNWYPWDGILNEWKAFLGGLENKLQPPALSPEESVEDIKFLLEMLKHAK